jgi:predicted DsbA family dithiol-disulfide isomerase
MGLKATAFVLALALTGTGGTCQGQSQGSSAQKDKDAPDVSLPGVDTSSLTPREKKEWSSYVSEFLSPCQDTPVPIAQCVKEQRHCARCLPAAKFLLKGVRDGFSREQIEQGYHARFDPEKVKNVAIDGSPSKGPDSAPITIIEFADFECPFCAMMAPQLEKTWADRKNQIRFVFKFFPLKGHPHGEPAARAGIAAWNQGKFWEMHDKMFANREHLEQSDLDAYAKELGLDLQKFHADLGAKATTDRLDRDRNLGDSLMVKGTPTIYINGRDYDPRQDLNDWLNLELGAPAAPPPSAAPSKPSASAPGPSASATPLAPKK